MNPKKNINLSMQIDTNNQWFVYCWVLLGEKMRSVKFKIDTGCNALVLSQATLRRFGYSTRSESLTKLPAVLGLLASGDEHVFRRLGAVSLYCDSEKAIHICDAISICHSTHETHDLLGTEVLRQFGSVVFNLKDKKVMELL